MGVWLCMEGASIKRVAGDGMMVVHGGGEACLYKKGEGRGI